MTQREGILRRNLLLGFTLATITEIVNSAPARAWLGYDFNDVNTLLRFNRQSGIRVLDAAGHFVGARGAYYAPPLEYEQMPRYLVLALVAQEDRCFFNDCLLRIGGLDLRAIGRAVIAAMKNGKASQGASTITQQVLKEIFLKEHNKYVRKVEEAALAPGLDLSLTKSDILFLYLNRVYFGAGAYGIEAASRVFFGKPAQHLGLTESVLLIQALPAPSNWNLRKNPNLASTRAASLLATMRELGFITQKQAISASTQRVRAILDHSVDGGYYPYSLQHGWYIRAAESESEHLLEDQSGVKTLRTHLDLQLQNRCQTVLSSVIARYGRAMNVNSGAVIAMKPDGRILALVGGANYSANQFNAAIGAHRQPGSAFKIFVYLAALERGVSPDDYIADDGPLEYSSGTVIDNYNHLYRGTITVADALAYSSNVAATRLIHKHIDEVIEMARRLGVKGPLKYDDGLALGISEVTLLELTAAYATIANDGILAIPYTVASMEDNMGQAVLRKEEGRRVLSRMVAEAMSVMLEGVVQKGTGAAARPGVWAAGKTGTTTDYRDAWFIGFTRQIAVGVWLGNRENEPMAKVTGGSLPAQIWRDIIQYYHSRPARVAS